MRLDWLIGVATLSVVAEPALACVGSPGDAGMRAAVAEKDVERNDAAQEIYLATLVASEDDRRIFVLQPEEAIIGALPPAEVRSLTRTWTSCGFIPTYYADWDRQLWNGESVIVVSDARSTYIAQIAALDTADGERVLALARARQERLIDDGRSATE
ncbi:hypothetical protein GGQ87_000660 [Brevundimonas alba]|uniref:Uncharacterized protein n=1 Tax=Brevundimonas alba TaxID=74314 RepID=A0A7X6BMI9_9CAUL|nr:hypothetical protein [Brevundimonas alba]NJC40402.1 hypothetical protein [Brevundimonas alba]